MMTTDNALRPCANCKSLLNDGDQWCPECGQPSGAVTDAKVQASQCPKCGEATDTLDEWCSACGTALTPAVSAVPPEEPAADQPVRTEVSVPVSLLQPIGGAGTLSSQPISSAVAGAVPAQATSINSALPGKTARRGWNSIFSHATCGGCFAQDVKDAPNCPKCGARFLTQEEIAEEEAELAKTDFDIVRDRTKAVLAGASVKASAARESLSATSQETFQAATSTKAVKSVQNYWVGWVVLGFVVLVGGFGLKLAVSSGQRKSEAIRATAAAAAIPTPRVPSPEEIHQADIDARWRKAEAYNAQAESNRRAEAEAQQRSRDASDAFFARARENASSIRANDNTPSATEIQQQKEQVQAMQAQMRDMQRQAEDNKTVTYICAICQVRVMRRKNDSYPSETNTACVKRNGEISGGHVWRIDY